MDADIRAAGFSHTLGGIRIPVSACASMRIIDHHLHHVLGVVS